MPMCGICKKEVSEQPKITTEGTCSVCGVKLKQVVPPKVTTSPATGIHVS